MSQTERQTDRDRDRQTGRQRRRDNTETGRQTGRQIDRQIQTDKESVCGRGGVKLECRDRRRREGVGDWVAGHLKNIKAHRIISNQHTRCSTRNARKT